MPSARVLGVASIANAEGKDVLYPPEGRFRRHRHRQLSKTGFPKWESLKDKFVKSGMFFEPEK